MKLSKRVKLFVALIASLYCVSLVQSTYAKYISGVDSDTNLSIARWNIVLSGSDDGTRMSGNIQPKFAATGNIGANVVAPTSTGYFDVAINGLNTDVAYDYRLDVSIPDDSIVQDIKVTGYQVKNDGVWGSTIPFADSNYLVTGHVSMNKAVIVRFWITWDDSAGATMDNEADTHASVTSNAAGSTEKAKLHVDANFIQSLG